ncbi:GNAT family N-acetyltransferase [Streptomyces sp. SID8379]|uniref:GNAT family N-acetyltransferase n=1 Tax=unclassified Streptomyces TaxID=2593676 RepID=UPI0003717086|nr:MULTISPECIES: GNAT family N-acetyltransferase [unclassified Streptomyces]MYW67792.1 GNAT family N-acetyltransferase [Streptomyces sp. SID8379]
MDYEVRPVRADEWQAVKELRLVALRDPAAPIAYLETYETALARPDSHWQDRAAGASHGMTARQFVAVADGGQWLGSLVALVEEAGSEDFFERRIERRQAQLVAVYVRPEARGGGVTRELFAAGCAWAFSLEGLERVRLHVHQDNARAEGFYRKFGFVRTGEVVPLPGDPSEPSKVEYEMEIKSL